MQNICYNSVMSWQHRQLMRPFPTATSLVVAAPHLSPSYSVHGQLTNEVQNGVSLARTYDTLNRPMGYSLDEEESLRSLRSLRLEYSYDADGNMTSDGRFHYFWNGENRLVCASNAEVVVTYAYDHRGRMVRKEISHRGTEARRIEYLWDDWIPMIILGNVMAFLYFTKSFACARRKKNENRSYYPDNDHHWGMPGRW